jgi:ABC-2 type transport system permease protein
MKRRIAAIIRKEAIQILRDWRSLVAAIALPMVLLTVYGYGINLDVRRLPTAVIDQDISFQSRELLDSFEQSGYFEFTQRLDSYSDLDRLMDRGEVKAAIVVPAGFARKIARGGPATMRVVVDGSDPSPARLAVSYATGVTRSFSQRVALREMERRGFGSAAVPGLDLRTRFWYNPELSSKDFLIPGLIALIMTLLSALLTSMTVVRERERGTIEQIIASPIKPFELIIGKMVPYVVIAFFDITLVVTAAKFIFGVPLVGSVPLLIVTSGLYLIVALGLGMLISSVANSQFVAMTLAVTTTMLPTVLLSGFVFPINSMPLPIRMITYIVPARYYLVIVRGIFLKGVGFSVLWPQAAVLLVAGVLLLTLSARRFKKVL